MMHGQKNIKLSNTCYTVLYHTVSHTLRLWTFGQEISWLPDKIYSPCCSCSSKLKIVPAGRQPV